MVTAIGAWLEGARAHTYACRGYLIAQPEPSPYADLARSTSGQTFQEKLAAELKAVDVKLPTITVQYNDFSITANAKKGDSISNVANTITSNLKRQVGASG